MNEIDDITSNSLLTSFRSSAVLALEGSQHPHEERWGEDGVASYDDETGLDGGLQRRRWQRVWRVEDILATVFGVYGDWVELDKSWNLADTKFEMQRRLQKAKELKEVADAGGGMVPEALKKVEDV